MSREILQGLFGLPVPQNCILPFHKPFYKVPSRSALNLNVVVVLGHIEIFLLPEDWQLKPASKYFVGT